MTADLAKLRAEHLVTAAELAELIETDPALVVLDVRFVLGADDGEAQYDAGHIPGAVYVDRANDLAGPDDPAAGRRPLPAVADFEAKARSWGINDDSNIVIYDDRAGMSATRAWWLLRWAGAKRVRLLDGAWPAWVAGGLPVSSQRPTPVHGSVSFDGGHLPQVQVDEVLAYARDAALFDARGFRAYAGDGGEGATGHIPGAHSFPAATHLNEHGFFASAEEILDEARGHGIVPGTEFAAYCGGGVSASNLLFALSSVGITGRLYNGSWSQWSHDPSRPVAVGVSAEDERIINA